MAKHPKASLTVKRTGVVPARRWLRLGAGLLLVGLLIWSRGAWWSPLCRTQGRAALQQRDFSAALGWTDAVNWLAPDDAETALLRARALRRLGRMDEAGQALVQAHALGAPLERLNREQWLALAQSGQMKQAEPQLSRLLIAPGEDGEEICEAFVLGYTRNQNFAAAYKLLQVWIADWPESATPYLLRGRLAFTRDNFRSAEEDFRRATELAPENREVRLELATVLKATQRPEEAIPLLETCRQDVSLRTAATLQLALCLKMTGEMERALPLLIELARESPGDPEILRELGRTQLEGGNATAAIASLQAALVATPYDDEVHYLLAQALQTAGRRDEAEPHFEYTREARQAHQELNGLRDALLRNPSDVEALVRSGELLLKYADPQEGVLRLLTAIDRSPANQQARRLLAEHYAARAAAEPEFQKLADEHLRWLKDADDADGTP